MDCQRQSQQTVRQKDEWDFMNPTFIESWEQNSYTDNWHWGTEVWQAKAHVFVIHYAPGSNKVLKTYF